jgi:putative ABC transport system permease protein
MSNHVSLLLSTKELWRNRGRFILIALVIALITLLVLFLAALGEGLGNGNKEYLGKLNAELILYQEDADLSVSASQFGRSIMNNVRRVEGVADAGAVGFSPVFINYAGAEEPLSVSMLGVEPGRPGEPPAFEGRTLAGLRASEVVLDRNTALRTGLGVGDSLTVLASQGGIDEFYDLTVVGISDGRQYAIQPSIFVPLQTWDRIRPRPTAGNQGELVFNIIAVQLADLEAEEQMASRLEELVSGVEAVDRVAAYQAAPGYSAQQSTIRTQQGFTLLIGVLVVGGFFQIQTLQKVAQVGVLKALGASNRTIALAASMQIILTNVIGVTLGAAAAFGLAAVFPPTVPIVFVGAQAAVAIITLLVIGPMGGLVSIRYLTRVEPLRALGLAS